MHLATVIRALLAAAFALALLTGLGDQRFFVPEDLKHAAIARETAASGNWLQPGAAGSERPDLMHGHRPPLIHLATAACIRIFGNLTWATKLPSTLSAAGTLLLVAWIGRMLGGSRTGLAAAGVLLSCLGFFAFARTLTPDMMVTLWITAAIACFVRRCAWRWKVV